MDLIRAITLQTLQYNFTFTATHIPGLDNSIADSLSRFQMDRFRSLAPSASPTASAIPPIGDEHLRGPVQRYLHASLAPSTRRTYQAGVKHFLTFTLMHGLIGPSNPLLPASEITLMYFASHLANTVSYETVKLYLVAVQDLHRELNFPLQLTEIHRLQKVLTGIKRLIPTKRRDRFPITLTVLHSIHS